MLVTWTNADSWSLMKSMRKPIFWPLVSLSVVPARLRNSVMEWMICAFLYFSSMTMKRMSSYMDQIWCFSWLFERLQKVSSISVIRSDMSFGVVVSVSPIASAVKKLRPWRGGPFICGEVWSVCIIVAPPLGDWRDDGTVLVSLVSLTKSASAVVTLWHWHGGVFLLGESQTDWAVALPPLWVSGAGGAEFTSLSSVARSRSLGRRLSMLMSVIVKVFVECCFLRDPWRRLILTLTKNCDHSFFICFFFCAHQFLRENITSKFY